MCVVSVCVYVCCECVYVCCKCVYMCVVSVCVFGGVYMRVSMCV